MKLKLYKHNSILPNIDDDIAKINTYYSSDFVKQFIPQGFQFQIDIEYTNVAMPQVPQTLIYPNDGKYDFVMYVFERNTFAMPAMGLTTQVSKTLCATYLAVDPHDDAVGFTLTSMCHELMHAITYKLLAERNIQFDPSWNLLDQDFTHNDDLYFVNGNYYKQLQKIATLFKPVVLLTRIIDNGTETRGMLTYKDFVCKTLERPYKANQVNVSAVPKGLYDVRWTFSMRMLCYTYEVQNVVGRSGIRIHSGNYYFDSNGCILLGNAEGDLNKDGQIDILNSRLTVQAFEKLLNKKPFTLKIL